LDVKHKNHVKGREIIVSETATHENAQIKHSLNQRMNAARLREEELMKEKKDGGLGKS
jgi:hypothetical protein